MLKRPLAPFRSRPVHQKTVRKTVEAGVIAKLADETATGIKDMKTAPRVSGPSAAKLRVLKPGCDAD